MAIAPGRRAAVSRCGPNLKDTGGYTMFIHARAGSAAAGLLLAMGIAGPAVAQTTFVFGKVVAVPSGSHASGARVELVGVLDFFGRPIFDITDEDPLGYSLFSVPVGEQVL